MQLRNMLKKLSVALMAIVALGVSSKAHASANYASGTRIYLATFGTAGDYVFADLKGQYNMYTNSDLLTNGTLATQSTLMQTSLQQQTRLMDVRLAALSGQKVVATANGARYVALAGEGTEKGQAAGSAGYNWGVWMSGRYTDFKQNHEHVGVNGDSWAGMLGADYRIHSNVILGLALSYEHVKAKTVFLKEVIKNDGYGVNPYLKFIINDNFDVDVFGGYAYINTKTNRDNIRYNYNRQLVAGKVSGSTHSNQWYGVLALNAQTVIADALTVRGKVGVNYITRKQKAFKQTFNFSTANTFNDTNVKGMTTDASQVFGDLRLGYMINENIEPFIKGGYAYDMSYKKYGAVEYDAQRTKILKLKTDRSNYTYGGGLNLGFGQFQAALDYERLEGARGLKSNTYLLLVRYNF